jgi:hypothetical protein
MRIHACTRLGDANVRERWHERHVVHVDAIPEFGPLADERARDDLKLDVDDVVRETPPVRESREIAPEHDRPVALDGMSRLFAIKAEVWNPRAKSVAFVTQKTMYGGKSIARGDKGFVFASENEGGQGLIARGVVTSAEAVAKKRGIARQTPRVSITVKLTEGAKRRLGRNELKPFTKWTDGTPEAELNLKFYRQATNKIAGISAEAAAFLDGFF